MNSYDASFDTRLLHELRHDVPALRQGQDIFLDNAATTFPLACVIDTMCSWQSSFHAPVHRGIYDRAEYATFQYEEVRKKIARFVGARDPREIIFTRGATEGCNMVALAWLRHRMRPGDTIVVTDLEHHANLLPWYEVARVTGGTVLSLPLHDDMSIQIDRLDDYITHRTRFVAVTGSSHIVGPHAPGVVEKIISAARTVGAAVLVDAAQMMLHQTVHVQSLDVDFLVFSGHKLCGPTGIGVLFCAQRLHDEMIPYMLGGGMVADAMTLPLQWREMPYRLEPGTPPITAVMGLGAALDYITASLPMDLVQRHEASLIRMLVEGLEHIAGVTILGSKKILQRRGHMVTITVDGMHPHDVAAALSGYNICVRAGTHCAQLFHERLGIVGSVRMSVAWYTTHRDIELLLSRLTEICAIGQQL